MKLWLAAAWLAFATAASAATLITPSPLENPETTFDVTDHFIHGSTETGEVGAFGWTTSGTGVGFNALTPTADRPGLRRLSGPATLNAIVNMNFDGIIPASMFDLTFWVSLPQITVHAIRLGYTTQPASSPPSDGIYFQHLPASLANWACVTRASSTETLTDSGVVVATDTWYKLRVRRVSPTAIQFSINGAVVAVHSTNVPTGHGQIWVQIQTLEAVSKSLDIDRVRLRITDLAD